MGMTMFSDGERTWYVTHGRVVERIGSPIRSGGRSRVVAEIAPERPARGAQSPAALHITGHLLASGIPEAGALSPVGSFLPGGPIHDDRAFAAMTQAGRVLDPSRLLVASRSNFGEPRARTDLAPGAILSLSTRAGLSLTVPPKFGSTGGQASALHGAVQLFTAQAPAFGNRLTSPGATTAGLPAVSDPLGISVNNAFGRLWFANSPAGPSAIGAESVLDPDGQPLADAPSHLAGGVFAGTRTDRRPQAVPGDLRVGAVANALLGASPDASGKAVFAVVTENGAVEQVHVQDGVDGLAPPGTIAPLAGAKAGPGGPTRVGMVFNWVPDRFLYISDPLDNAVVKLHLGDDFHVFHVLDTRRLHSRYFSEPIDLAPAVPEVANPAFASNTTLAGGADIYVANRGSGTIVRLRQDGRIRALARISVPGYGLVGPGLVNGIAVSTDARTIWVSLSADRSGRSRLSGSVIRIPAFGAPR
jgi:hypothetical protein